MPKQNEAQREKSQNTLQRLALQISSLDEKIKKMNSSQTTLTGGHCPQSNGKCHIH